MNSDEEIHVSFSFCVFATWGPCSMDSKSVSLSFLSIGAHISCIDYGIEFPKSFSFPFSSSIIIIIINEGKTLVKLFLV